MGNYSSLLAESAPAGLFISRVPSLFFSSNHDFFSQVGNSYLLGEVESMSDDDYTIGMK
jgi:hypothetical protein